MDSCICGFHVYLGICRCLLYVFLAKFFREDRYAVAIYKLDGVGGHIISSSLT